jgi:peptidoglycan/LPS O-acetylase OafA/YrhL
LEHCWPAYSQWSATGINLGQTGVLLFFVISGFIIPASLSQGGSQARFWLRRFFRLFPLYWTVIACAWVTGFNRLGAQGPAAWLVNLTMLQGFVGLPNAVGVFWTLQWELLIYLVTAVLFATGALKRPVMLIWLVIGFYLASGLIWRPLVLGKPFYLGGNLWFVTAPFFGMAFECHVSGRLSRRGLHWFLACFYVGIPLIFAVNSFLLPQQHSAHREFRYLCGNWLFAYSGFALLMAVRERFKPGLLAWLGEISYSIYLVHLLVLALLLQLSFPTWTLLPLLFGGTLALAALTFRWIEQPGIMLGRALEKRWLKPAAPSNALLADVIIRQAHSMPASSPCSAPGGDAGPTRGLDRV